MTERTYCVSQCLRPISSSLLLWGSVYIIVLARDYQTAQKLGTRLLHLAQVQSDSARLLSAHAVLGSTYLFTGELLSAHAHLEQALIISDDKADEMRSDDSCHITSDAMP